jgi:hypothetical protein
LIKSRPFAGNTHVNKGHKGNTFHANKDKVYIANNFFFHSGWLKSFKYDYLKNLEEK